MADEKKPLPSTPTDVRRSTVAIAVAAIATLALIAADLGTKEWAADTLSVAPSFDPGPPCEGGGMQRRPGENVVIVEDHLMLRYAENCGAAFGMLRDANPLLRKALFGTAAVAASIALFVMFVRGRGGPFFAWSVPMIVSGALGNLIDRVRLGYVIDFIRAYNLNLPYLDEWPTFNVADIGITVGVALLVIDGFRQPDEESEAGEKADSEEKAGATSAKQKKGKKAVAKKVPKKGASAAAVED